MVGFGVRDRLISTFILTLRGLPGVGPATLRRVLVEHKGPIETSDVLDESFARGMEVKQIDRALARDGVFWSELEEQANATVEMSQGISVSVLHPYMAEYPQKMLWNERFPPILFCQGSVAVLNQKKSAAIIGSRRVTDYGRILGQHLAERLAGDGYAIVSGLALGSDTAGHEGALNVGGVTVALLPTPLGGPVYPEQNRELAERIVAQGGALVSEYSPGTYLVDRELVKNLVERDEWQAALADGVVATETSVKGGTNHAIRHALETGTPVAVLDYGMRDKEGFDFESDERFEGNVRYLRAGEAMPIRDVETIEAFKAKMDEYRSGGHNIHWQDGQASDGGPASPHPLTLF